MDVVVVVAVAVVEMADGAEVMAVVAVADTEDEVEDEVKEVSKREQDKTANLRAFQTCLAILPLCDLPSLTVR